MTWTTLSVLNWTSGRFAERGIASARLDAELLLAKVLGLSRVGLYTAFDRPLHDDELGRYRDLIKRRLAGEPVAYLLGEQEFWSLPLHVDARVLIPRRDTETLVEVGRAAGGRRIADVATGSGAVALALAKELPDAHVVATDVSEAALEVARMNVARHELGERIELRAGDLVTPLDGTFDLIVSNPPYVPSGQIGGLAAEVRREPRAALDGGADGLDVVRRLVAAALPLLADEGTLAVEHGYDQGAAVRALFAAAGYAGIATTKDLGANERVTAGKRNVAAGPGSIPTSGAHGAT